MSPELNFIKKNEEVLLVEPYCSGFFHSTINVIILNIILKYTNKFKFVSSYSHLFEIKEIINLLKIENVNLKSIGLFKKDLFSWKLNYFFNLIHSFILIIKGKYSRVIFCTSDYTFFPLCILILNIFIKKNIEYFLVIHKGSNIIQKKNLIKMVWFYLFNNKYINFIFLDENCNKSINIFKNKISDPRRIFILKCKSIDFNINPEEKNTLNKIFIKARDYKYLMNTKKLLTKKYYLDFENDYLFIKTSYGEKLSFFILPEDREVNSVEYLRILNQV